MELDVCFSLTHPLSFAMHLVCDFFVVTKILNLAAY